MNIELVEQAVEDIIVFLGEGYEPKQEEYVTQLFENAVDEVVDTMFPYQFADEDELEIAREKAYARYKGVIKNIVKYHYNKNGKDGVMAFTENGVTHTYEASGTPPSLLKRVIPIVKIVE